MFSQTVTRFEYFSAHCAVERNVVYVLGLYVPRNVLLEHGHLAAVRAGPRGAPAQLEHLRQDLSVKV